MVFKNAVQGLRKVKVRGHGNRQRLAFTVGVSQHMHKITNL